MPLALVGSVGCVSVLPVPLAARVTLTPCSGLPNWSRTVTVIVDALDPLDALMLAGSAVTVLCDALIGPGAPVAVNTTGPPLSSTPGTAADSALAPASVPRVHAPTAATPSSPLTGVSSVTEPPPSVTVKVTGMPLSGLPSASRTMTAGGTGTAVPTVAL